MAFEGNYAEFYDLLYQNKDYEKEARYIDELIIGNSKGGKQSKILDLACGTGKHAFLLEDMGYEIDGSDISSDMINHARNNAISLGSKVNFYNHSFQESNRINRKYDVVTSMFSAFNYLNTLEDIQKTLKNIYGLLEDDGIFIFDYWNGNAVVRDYSPIKVLRLKNDSGELIRISDTSIDLMDQIAEVKFTCLYFKNNAKEVEFTELHKMRYFYFSELENILRTNGFGIKFRAPFLSSNDNGIFDSYEWNISIVAHKI